jgi:hypothetical protein
MNTKNLLLLSFIVSVLVCCKHKDETEPQHGPQAPWNCQEPEFTETDNSLMQQFLKRGVWEQVSQLSLSLQLL